jgi:hypothetical protein
MVAAVLRQFCPIDMNNTLCLRRNAILRYCNKKISRRNIKKMTYEKKCRFLFSLELYLGAGPCRGLERPGPLPPFEAPGHN